MSHSLLTESIWAVALLVSGIAFAASAVVAYVTSKMSGDIRKSLLLLSLAAFFGSFALALPAFLHSLHVPLSAAAWNLQAALYLSSGATYAAATKYFSRIALRLNSLSAGMEDLD